MIEYGPGGGALGGVGVGGIGVGVGATGIGFDGIDVVVVDAAGRSICIIPEFDAAMCGAAGAAA